jgi:putative membrane protein
MQLVRKIMISVVIVGALAVPALAQSADDAKFVKTAAASGMAEVQLAQLAEQKSTNPAVKAFAQTMVRDHTAANEALKKIADTKKIQVPTQLSDEDKQVFEKLSTLSGADFDKMFVKKMVEDHTKAIQLFTQQSMEGKDPELKAWAKGTLPILKQHKEMADRLAAGVS